METFGERFKQLRKEKGLTQDKLGEIFFLNKSSISKYENNNNVPEIEALQAFADYFGVTVDYLLGRTDIRNPLPSNAIPLESNLVKIPVIGVIRAGMPILAKENIEGWEYIEESEVKGGDYFYLRVKGDSMVGARIMDGDLVLIRKQPDVEHGEIAAVRVNGDEATLKRVLKVDNSIILQPENHSYHPRLCTHEELISGYVEIIGKVMEVKFKL